MGFLRSVVEHGAEMVADHIIDDTKRNLTLSMNQLETKKQAVDKLVMASELDTENALNRMRRQCGTGCSSEIIQRSLHGRMILMERAVKEKFIEIKKLVSDELEFRDNIPVTGTSARDAVETLADELGLIIPSEIEPTVLLNMGEDDFSDSLERLFDASSTYSDISVNSSYVNTTKRSLNDNIELDDTSFIINVPKKKSKKHAK